MEWVRNAALALQDKGSQIIDRGPIAGSFLSRPHFLKTGIFFGSTFAGVMMH